MNNFKYLILLLVSIIIFSSCQDEDESSNPSCWSRDYWGEISITRNGESVDLLVAGIDHDMRVGDFQVRPGMGIVLSEYKNMERTSSLTFQQIPCEAGLHQIESNEEHSSFEPTVNYFTLRSSDVVGDGYITDNTKVNFLSIDSVRNDNEVFGHFELNLIRDTTLTIILPLLPDTYTFECDFFHTRLTSSF